MLFIRKVYVQDGRSIAAQLRRLLRGQWVVINGYTARIVNHTGDRVVVAFNNRVGESDIAVFA